MELFIAGSTARTAARLVGVHRNTAAYYFHRLREIIACELARKSDEVFAGEIEVDESYFGGRRKGKRARLSLSTPVSNARFPPFDPYQQFEKCCIKGVMALSEDYLT